MTDAQLLRPVLDDIAALVEDIRPDQWGASTPCREYDLAALVEHVVGWVTTFAAGFSDPQGRAPGGPTAVEGVAPADAVRTAARRLDDALAAGAAGRPLVLGEAVMPGDTALSMILWEYQVHGWDLAAALDRDWEPHETGLAASLAFAPGMLSPEYQGEGKPFAPAVPVDDDAPALDRLVALSGRDPLWRVGDAASFLAVVSLRAQPGRGDDLVALLGAGPVATDIGCTAYVVASDPDDGDRVWISETWLSRRHHAASLRLPAIRRRVAEAMPLLTGETTQRRLEVRRA